METRKIKGPVRTAVIGVGKLGQHHARIYSTLKDVRLIGVVDKDPKQLEKISKGLNVPGYSDLSEILDKADAVTISAPTVLHYRLAREIIGRGIHCLVEKPLTADLSEAKELVKTAGQNNTVLQVGHIERFNPAVIEAQKYIKNPRFIEALRMGPYDPRIEVGVVLDVMIHDLDLIMFFVGSRIKDMETYGAKVFTSQEDIVKVRLRFDNGCVADITASRISPGKYRGIRIFQPDAYISLNFIGQSLKIFRKKVSGARSMDDIEVLRPKVEKKEPLRLELEHFIECVREGKKPAVSGEQGSNALEAALAIMEQLRRNNG